MEKKSGRKNRKVVFVIYCCLAVSLCVGFCGCSGYSNASLFPANIDSVCVDMFDNKSFRRGIEYDLTDALAKRIETDSPYKVISNKDKAQTLISGYIVLAGESVLVTERETGRALEKGIELQAVVSWKNLKTGELLLDNVSVSASADYSEWQSQGFDYGSTLAANKLAQRIVELMEKGW